MDIIVLTFLIQTYGSQCFFFFENSSNTFFIKTNQIKYTVNSIMTQKRYLYFSWFFFCGSARMRFSRQITSDVVFSFYFLLLNSL